MANRERSRSPVGKKSMRHDESNTVKVINIPKHWTVHDVKGYLKDHFTDISNGLGFVTLAKGAGDCLLRFDTTSALLLALKQLDGVKCEGNFLRVKRYTKKYQPPHARESKKTVDNANPWNRDKDYETYGLATNFLNSLGIKPPLHSKVFISNLDERVDESKLREVFSHAGHIVNITLMKKNDTFRGIAKVEFDHPVEAVQAISMCNNQELYGKQMSVKLDNVHKLYLPDGLTSFGPGLGSNGEPMKGVRNFIELQPIKKLLMEHVNSLKQNMEPDNQQMQAASNMQPQKDLNLNAFAQYGIQNPAFAVQNQLLQSNPMFSQNMFGQMQSYIQPTLGTDMTALAVMQAQNQISQTVPVVSQSLSQNQSPWGSMVPAVQPIASQPNSEFSFETNSQNKMSFDSNLGRSEAAESKNTEERDRDMMNSSDMVVFRYLPPSVTEHALSNKMRDIGDLKFVEMTGHGKAIVRFARSIDAERCVKLFDRSTVDGVTIEVKFL